MKIKIKIATEKTIQTVYYTTENYALKTDQVKNVINQSVRRIISLVELYNNIDDSVSAQISTFFQYILYN